MRHHVTVIGLVVVMGIATAVAADAPQFKLRGDRFQPLTWDEMTLQALSQ